MTLAAHIRPTEEVAARSKHRIQLSSPSSSPPARQPFAAPRPGRRSPAPHDQPRRIQRPDRRLWQPPERSLRCRVRLYEQGGTAEGEAAIQIVLWLAVTPTDVLEVLLARHPLG